MKDKMKKNLGLKILSLLIAVVIWILIVNVEDPVETKKFEDISVTIINGDVITEKDKVYTVTGGSTVDVSVTGRRSFVNSLNRSDIVAVADLSKLSYTGAAYIETEITKYTTTHYEMELGSTKMLTVESEDKISDKYSVVIQLSGEIDSGYTISEKLASPNMITVSGAESVIKKIHQVVLAVNVQGRTASFQKVINKNDFLVYDNNKDLIDNSKLEFSVEDITVNIALQKTKEVELRITPVGKPKNGYRLQEFEYEPKKIIVSGDEAALDAVSVIPYEYDITDKFEDYEENLPISDELLNVIKSYGVSPVDETQTIAISVKFEELKTDEVKINADDIEIRNLPSSYNVQINTSAVSALVQGGEHTIRKLVAADLEPYIDLSRYSTGTTLVNVQFEGNGEYEIINKPTINITISEKSSMGTVTSNNE